MAKIYARVLVDAGDELSKALRKYPASCHDAHHQFGKLLEEVDELWDEVRRREKKRNPKRMRKEAIQVAAMALRFAMEVCDR